MWRCDGACDGIEIVRCQTGNSVHPRMTRATHDSDASVSSPGIRSSRSCTDGAPGSCATSLRGPSSKTADESLELEEEDSAGRRWPEMFAETYADPSPSRYASRPESLAHRTD